MKGRRKGGREEESKWGKKRRENYMINAEKVNKEDNDDEQK